MLEERASAIHIENLGASADKQHGKFASKDRIHESELPVVTPKIGLVGVFARFLVIAFGVDIPSSCEHESVNPVENAVRDVHRGGLWGQQHRNTSRTRHALDVSRMQERRIDIPHARLCLLTVCRDADDGLTRGAQNREHAPSQ
ncbi:unannotated protein [freshwater metagenome]|uniref:Unannotated protein n=1 Tax=freshwater metagenome TaxID=449393 RepID=A0A6J7DL66_9ZZZZ